MDDVFKFSFLANSLVFCKVFQRLLVDSRVGHHMTVTTFLCDPVFNFRKELARALKVVFLAHVDQVSQRLR